MVNVIGGRRATRALRALPLLILLAVGLNLACSGSGGDDDGPSPLPCTSIDFVRVETTAPQTGDVYLQGTGTCTGLDVSVLVSNLSDIFTVGFDITYPASLLTYQTYSVGPLLLKGNPVFPPLTFVSASAGRLQVTMTRFAPDPGVTATGSESLIVFHFTKGSPGAGLIDFDMSGTSTVAEQILDQNGAVLPASFGPDHGGVVTVP